MIFLTHHKCASSLLHDWVAELCRVNERSFFTSHLGSAAPHPGYDVSLLTNAVYARVAGRAAVHVIRNPMSVLVSAYHSHLATHDVAGWPELAEQRERLRGVDAAEGMKLTLAFCERPDFYADTPGPLGQLGAWDFDDPRIATARMEDFGDDPGAVLGPLLGEGWVSPDPARFTFEALAGGRMRGEVDGTSHYRSGDPEAWRRELPAAVQDRVRERYGAILARYYPDSL